MSSAKKIPEAQVPSNEDVIDELEFDVEDDWRKSGTATHTNIFKDEDMDVEEEELDIGDLSLDMDGAFAKQSAKDHAAEQAKKTRHSKRTGKSETLEQLQAAVDGESSGEQEDEMEILNEEDKALVNDPIFTNKDDLYPQIHGNYFLLDHMVDGGMAKVCRARYLGEGDEADKMVAIKMVQEKFSSDEDFVQMFIDEIKVSFGLNHPNINTTFDYGKIGKNLFVSMEYIHGKDLMDVVDDLREAGKTIPIPIAIYITSKMCEALHYAHNFTNQLTGQKYNIVHRDISPHNVMVSYEGYVKVIDFGIAKADTNSTEEAEGTIKGKINYFAPEYLEGKNIDHRYDQFAVALTLWEMLTGDKTFKGSGQIETLKTILACNPEKASKHNSEVTAELDAIISRALSRDPANRYKDMLGFNRDLMKLLYKDFPDFHESDISTLMKDLFSESYASDLSKFKEFGKYSISDIVAKINAFKEFQKRQAQKAADKKGPDSVQIFDFGFEEEAISAKSKKGIDSLVKKRNSKKKKKKAPSEASESRRQKALASLLVDEFDDDDDDSQPVKANIPWIKFSFMGLLVLGYAKRDLFFSSPTDQMTSVKEVSVTAKNKPFEKLIREEVKKPVQVELTAKELKAQMEALIAKKKKEAQEKLKQEELRKKALEASVNGKSKIAPAPKAQEKALTPQARLSTAGQAQQVGSVVTAPKNVTATAQVGKKAELSPKDIAELSKSERELYELRKKMNSLLEQNDALEGGAVKVKQTEGTVSPAKDQKKLNAKELEKKRLNELMASKLNELEEEEVAIEEESDKEGLSGKFLNFIKTRKAFSWIFK
jgi:serine/threonine protein kinase